MNLSIGRQRDARTYRRLAAWARCHGYRRVSRHAIRKWTIAGLLPNSSRVSVGWGPPSTAQHIATGAQLLRLCHYRYAEGLGRLDAIAGNLLIDGFEVDLDRVRRAMMWARDAFAIEERRKLGPSRRNLKDRWLHNFSLDPTVVAGMPGLDRVDRELLLDELASMTQTSETSRFARSAVRRTTGVADSLVEQLRPFMARPSKAEVDRALRAPDADLVGAARLVAGSPELLAGVDQVRSARTRAIRRLVMFTAVVRQFQLIARISG